MKLRNRQDKVERILSICKTSKGNPFQESSTLVRGEVDFLGALLIMDKIDEQNCDALSRAGIRTGIDSRFTFETTIGPKDTLAAEFVARQKGKGYLGEVLGQSLSLEKVLYKTNSSDWLSAVAIPVGAQYRDVAISTISSHQVQFICFNIVANLDCRTPHLIFWDIILVLFITLRITYMSA